MMEARGTEERERAGEQQRKLLMDSEPLHRLMKATEEVFSLCEKEYQEIL